MALADTAESASSIPIVDTHVHFFDPRRPQGVPWPPKDNTALYKPALPDRYRGIAGPLGIVGCIEVEASPLLEDNQWVLDIAAKDKIVVGTVGDLEPGKPDFAKQLERFHANPLFRGIRYGNLWPRDTGHDDLGKALAKPEFVQGLKLLAQAGLVLDTANPDPALIAAVVRATDAVPDLRVVLDHMPRFEPPYPADLHELAKRKQVYMKISGVPRWVDGHVSEDLSFYRGRLDDLFGLFGEDRVIYGSDWPNSDNFAPYAVGLKLVREYFTAKGQAIAEKYFWKNSVAAYRWVKRAPNQPG